MTLLYKCLLLFLSTLIFPILYYQYVNKKTYYYNYLKKVIDKKDKKTFDNLCFHFLFFALIKLALVVLEGFIIYKINPNDAKILALSIGFPAIGGELFSMFHRNKFSDTIFNIYGPGYSKSIFAIYMLDDTFTIPLIITFFTSIVLLIGNLP